MKWVLIGHRGVGKTSLLKRLSGYHPEVPVFDLDQKIEEVMQKPITRIFPEVGEKKFREIEIEVFQKIQAQNPNFIISVGGGFTLEALKDVKIIWVRRKTDEKGRIFLNRPRLNAKVSPLQEYQERYQARQDSYQKAADEIYFMPEGLNEAHPVEKWIFTQGHLKAHGLLTLTPKHFKDPSVFLRSGSDLFELRDDLVDLSNDNWKQIPKNQRLISFRKKEKVSETLMHCYDAQEVDWALELGSQAPVEATIVSSHDYQAGENLQRFLHRLEDSSLSHQHLKAAPVISTFEEWQILFKWWLQDPSNRSILPRSRSDEKGKWVWARLYMKGRQKINFWRDAEGSAWDQPTLFEWLSTPSSPSSFAALLGNPVEHSKTMVEQSAFFALKNWPVWPILIQEEEFPLALKILKGHGLQAAAVTSPLKKQAYQNSAVRTAEAEALQSVNTLCLKDSQFFGHNTDLMGLQAALGKAAQDLNTSLNQLNCVIWGGGGTLSSIQKIVPQGISVSLRSGKTRDENQVIPEKTQVLIWAAGPLDSFNLDNLKFDLIVDLNYREDSLARELALARQVPYISGDLMFQVQAQGQREFFEDLFRLQNVDSPKPDVI